MMAEFLGSEYGGWAIDLSLVDRNSVVYSFGIGTDVSFDLALIERCGAQVYAFDPTPRSLDWIEKQSFPEEMIVYPWGISDHNGWEDFFPPKREDHVSYTIFRNANGQQSEACIVFTLQAIMHFLGHDVLDVLKLDIEGGEQLVIDNMIGCGIYPKQLLFEYHRQYIEEGALIALVQRIRMGGYWLEEQRGYDFLFIRGDDA